MKAMDLPWTAIAQETGGARKAALVLHALAGQDRESIVSGLAEHERAVVEPLLAELSTLGLPPDWVLAGELVDAAALSGEASRRQEQPLENARGADLVEVLGHEPPGLIAVLLNVQAWSWAADLMAALPAPRRRQVEAALGALREGQNAGSRARPEALEAELLGELMARLAVTPRSSASLGHWKNLTGRLRHLARWRSS